MKVLSVISAVLIFSLTCSVSTAVIKDQEKSVQKERTETVKNKQKAPENKEATSKPKETGAPASIASEKKQAKEGIVKQEATKPEKVKAAEEKIRSFIKKIEEEQRTATAEEKIMEEISGLIIEETMTKIGYEFYEYFFLLWEPPQEKIGRYNILISEKASPMWGSSVTVNVDENIVWSVMLRPRSEEIEEAVKQAIEATKNYLLHYKDNQFQSEDLLGTGI